MGWPHENNITVNIKYPDNAIGKTLSYVMLTVYQGSLINSINVVDGGIGQTKISIDISANETKYLLYNATFYGTGN